MNISLLLKKLYPEGSWQGQCGTFAHKLIEFPSVGDSYSQKKQAVREYGILAEQLAGDFRVGDVVITSEGTFMGMGHGHVAVVVNVSNGQPQVVESNFKLKEKVSYGRPVPVGKIYGVIKGAFKFPVEIPKPLTLRVNVFINNQKPWNKLYFEKLKEEFSKISGGKVVLDLYPLYTKFQNWWYRAYGSALSNEYYNVIAKEYLDETVMPLAFSDPHIIILVISKKQWQGSVFNSPNAQELGWYYPGSKLIVFVCDDGDISIPHFGTSAFVDYAIHEISHYLYHWGLDITKYGFRRDLTHDHYNANEMEKIFSDLDLKRLHASI
jgi:hypothetical protein